VELICDRVAIMVLGKLRGIGTINELIENHPAANQASVIIEATGSTEQMTQCLDGCAVRSIQVLQDKKDSQVAVQRIDVDAVAQSNVDRVVDRLRQASISIYRMERFRPSLEQVFMSVVATANGTPTKITTN